MATRKLSTAALAAALGIVLPLAVLQPAAQARPAAPRAHAAAGTDPRALRLLAQMTAAYQSLQTYSGTEIAQGSGALGMPYEMSLAYQRPGQMTADITRHFGGKTVVGHLLLDGKALYVSSSGLPSRTTRATRPQTNYSLWEDALVIREDVKFPLVMQMLEQGGPLARALARPGLSATLGPPATLDGVPVDTVVIKTTSAQDTAEAVWQIGRRDHLLRRYAEDTHPLHQDSRHTSQTFLHVRANPVLPASLFVFNAPPGVTVSEDHPGGAAADPAATALVAGMYAAYDALGSFSCRLEVTLHGPSYGPRGMTITTSPIIGRAAYAIQKPARALVTRTSSSGTSQAVSDGTTLYVTTTEPNDAAAHSPTLRALPGVYLKLPLQADPGNIAYNLANFGGLGNYGGGGQQLFVPQALLGWKVMPADSYDWKTGPAGDVNGEPVDTVTLRRGSANDTGYSIMTLALSRHDHLLRQVTTEYHNGTEPAQQELETFTDVRANPILPASLFVFNPPPGSHSVPVASQLTAKR